MTNAHINQSGIHFRSISDLHHAEHSPLLSDDVHVWGVCLDLDDRQVAPDEDCLSIDERGRASRFLSVVHRQRFMAAHSALRSILSRYCQTSPRDLCFQRSVKGKPFLSDPRHGDLRFNLSHSHDRALVAVTRGREVGIDLEKVRPKLDAMRLAQRFLSPKEQSFILQAEDSNRHERFLHVWVAREAGGKAEGSGITFPLNKDHMEIDLRTGEGQLISHRHRSDETPMIVRWLPMDHDWFGAVAAHGTEWRVKLLT